MGKECKEQGVQLESKQQGHWLENGERFLENVYWLRGKFQFSVYQAFTGNQSCKLVPQSLNLGFLGMHE